MKIQSIFLAPSGALWAALFVLGGGGGGGVGGATHARKENLVLNKGFSCLCLSIEL